MNEMNKIRPIAFYLPQFHPIPENDEWWSKGFTEWTNVAKAKPLFKGHQQPNLPGELGFYDLRLSEVREQQAALAKEYGIEGFMYWHYWFAGKRLLERPFKEVLESKKPDFPFCLGWANETWSGVWHGAKDKILMEQTYPGEADYVAHFYAVLDAFKDPRYITVEGKPLFTVYVPFNLPDASFFIATWQKLAKQEGLNGIYFVGFSGDLEKDYQKLLDMGFDGVHFQRIKEATEYIIRQHFFHRLQRKLYNMGLYKRYTFKGIYDYEEYIRYLTKPTDTIENAYPVVVPKWDNSPRSGRNSLIVVNSTPELFRKHLRNVFQLLKKKRKEQRIVFIKSWNEWAEGNYMEPDSRFGRKYLEVFKEEVNRFEADE
ncbi:glycosyl transferase [Bacteroidia bacterium]|nr:glycosyl transferase [Bacteroidia bacterium]